MLQAKLLSPLLLTLLAASVLGCADTNRHRDNNEQARTHERAGEYVDDSVITAKVKGAIFGDSTLKSMEINVETFKGVVQLSGFVNSRQDIHRAVEVAGNVAGVKSVKNDMRVK